MTSICTSHNFSNQLKPNVLFVLDYSGSMLDDVYGNDPAISGLHSKIDILKSALSTVLDENIDVINAGIGSIFDGSASGNRWPVTELNADANGVDPDIPVGQFTVREFIGKQIEQDNAAGSTRTVSGLAESALYLRGGPVLNGDRDVNQPLSHKPDRWDVSSEKYNGGNGEAALAIRFTPSDTAYAEGVNEPDNFKYCYNQSCDGLRPSPLASMLVAPKNATSIDSQQRVMVASSRLTRRMNSTLQYEKSLMR